MRDERRAKGLPEEFDTICLVSDFCLPQADDHPACAGFLSGAVLSELSKLESGAPRLRFFALTDVAGLAQVLEEQLCEGLHDTSFYDSHREDASLLWITHYRDRHSAW